jgi:hypothetical protein
MSTRHRYIFVDVLRSLAIALALAAHALNDFDVLSRLTEAEFTAVRILTRAATPSFIFMFGMMLELVYARRIATSGLPAVVPKLLWRSLQCYFGYVLTVLTGWSLGLFDWTHATQAAVFIFGAHHGNILKFYTVALLVAIPLLALRNRVGLGLTLTFCFGLWLISPLLNTIAAVPVGRFGGILELGFQLIPYSLTFIGAGMWVGNSLRRPDNLSARFHLHIGHLLAICAGGVGLLMLQSSPSAVLHSYLDYYDYRHSHHIGYYLIGLLQALGLCLLFFHLIPHHRSTLSPSSFLLTFGRASLLSFTLGNIVLNVLVGRVFPTAYEGLFLTIGVIGLVLLLALGMERLIRAIRTHPRLSILVHPAILLQNRLVGPASTALLDAGRWARNRLHKRAPSLSSLRWPPIP